jgi:hypothetical protein
LINLELNNHKIEIYCIGDDTDLSTTINSQIDQLNSYETGKEILEMLESYPNLQQIKIYDLNNQLLTISDYGSGG